MPEEFLAGAASVAISPDEPTRMKVRGLNSDVTALGVLPGHELYADALAVRAGGRSAVFVTFDGISVRAGLDPEVRRAVADRTGIDDTRVVVAARHNHSSAGVPADEKDAACVQAAEAYGRKVRDGLVEASVRALGALRPAEIAAATMMLKAPVGVSRRARLAYGGSIPSWGSGPVAVPGERFAPDAGPDSPRIDFLCAREIGAPSPFAVFFSYASHIHLGAIPYFNSETVGGVKAAFARAWPGATVVYANKTGGDIDMHVLHPMPEDPAEQVAWYTRTTAELGRRLAGPVLESAASLRYFRPESLAHECLGVAPLAVAPAPARAEGATAPAATEPGAAEPTTRPGRAGAAGAGRNIVVNAIRLGEVAIATVPSELFLEYVNQIHDQAPFRTLLLLGFNSGLGYMGTPLTLEQGGYETSRQAVPIRPPLATTGPAGAAARPARGAPRETLGQEVAEAVIGVLKKLA